MHRFHAAAMLAASLFTVMIATLPAAANGGSFLGSNCDNNGRCGFSGEIRPNRKAVQRVKRSRVRVDANGNAAHRRAGYVTVQTAAGPVTVAPKMAAPISGFISDLVARGYTPKRVSCLNYGRSHVKNSLHFRGLACDFDQHGWGKTASMMYRVSDLARKWGLRDGGQFRDWGHIDMGPNLSRSRIAAAARHAPFYEATAMFKRKLVMSARSRWRLARR